MNKKLNNYFIALIGIALLTCGLFLIKSISNPEGILSRLPYILVGLGCGVFGHGAGDIMKVKIMNTDLDAKKQMEIEKNDERNIAIQNSAKAKTYDMMVFVFGALLLSLALMNVDIMVILMLASSYLFVIGYGIYYRIKYDREM